MKKNQKLPCRLVIINLSSPFSRPVFIRIVSVPVAFNLFTLIPAPIGQMTRVKQRELNDKSQMGRTRQRRLGGNKQTTKVNQKRSGGKVVW